MKAHKTKHLLQGSAGIYGVTVFDHKDMRRAYIDAPNRVHLQDQHIDNNIAPWINVGSEAVIDCYPLQQPHL